MLIESLVIVALALALDLTLGDPKNKFHPTAWIGRLIGRLTPYAKTGSAGTEKIAGAILVASVVGMVMGILYAIYYTVHLISTDVLYLIVSVIVGGLLLKTTIAIRGMQTHAMRVAKSIQNNDMQSAKDHLSMIVKRDTSSLDKNHTLSGVLESVSENTVDGITGAMFYFGCFGIFGAFAYRIVNTFDSMIGYRSEMFANLGWFAAKCDDVLNYVPSRLTGLVMVLGSFLLGYDWRQSYHIMTIHHSELSSINAGYPIAALAGALNITLQKTGHYTVGNGTAELDISHVRSSIRLMKVTSLLFCGLITVPLVLLLYYMGWWIHA